VPKEKFYVTTSIVYANAKPHIGFALELAQADAIARWQRLLGKDVYFLTGTDEHGIKIYNAAKEAGKDPQAFVDENAAAVRQLLEKLNISKTDFIRTTDRKRHWPAAQKMWELLQNNGDVERGHYAGYYSVTDEAYITKTEYESGEYAGKKVIELKEDNYLFKLDRYKQQLKNVIGRTLSIIPAHRAEETLNFLEAGPSEISFSRPKDRLPWGIPVPGDDSQVMYVWCDALTNYVSALGYPDDPDGKYKKYWPADLHVIGKDILRFHAIFWPAMLMGAKLALPKEILVHGHILAEGKKMSKSVGNVIDPIELIDKWGADAVRYYLLREIPTTEDGDYSGTRFVEVYNSALANDLGNLLSRTLAMAHQYLDGVVPTPTQSEINISFAYEGLIKNQMDMFNLSRVLENIWERAVSWQNQYIDSTKPWQLAKDGDEKLKEVLYNLLENMRHLSIMLYPFLPETSDKICKQLGLEPINPDNFDFAKETEWGGLPAGHKLGQSEILFPKQEDK